MAPLAILAAVIASLLIAFAVMALLAMDATIHPPALVISVEVNAPSAKCSLAKALSAIFADVIQSAARFSAAIALSAIFAFVIASALIALAVMALFEMVATFTSSLVVPPAYPVPSNMSSQLSAAVVSPLIWVTLTFGNVVPYFQSK